MSFHAPNPKNDLENVSTKIRNEIVIQAENLGLKVLDIQERTKNGKIAGIDAILHSSKLMDKDYARQKIVLLVEQAIDMANSQADADMFFETFPVSSTLFAMKISGPRLSRYDTSHIQSARFSDEVILYNFSNPGLEELGLMGMEAEPFETAKKMVRSKA
ncbi:MAG: hypothetical protein H7A36_04255 [Chlamydiales bacterium]|nr:hypothetical protein [Chlamydiales bacterium]